MDNAHLLLKKKCEQCENASYASNLTSSSAIVAPETASNHDAARQSGSKYSVQRKEASEDPSRTDLSIDLRSTGMPPTSSFVLISLCSRLLPIPGGGLRH